jgi:hypothetical protein
MECPEHLRLQQVYEAALRRWAQVFLPTDFYGERTYLAEQVWTRVIEERDAAKSRLVAHRQCCSVCRRKPRNGLSTGVVGGGPSFSEAAPLEE